MNEELEQAYALVLADLEYRNSHLIGRLLEWDISGKEDEVMYRTWLVAKNFLYSSQATPKGAPPWVCRFTITCKIPHFPK